MRQIDVVNPRTGAVDFHIQAANEEDIALCVADIRKAQPKWAAYTVSQRAEILQLFANQLLAHRREMLAALSQDTGRYLISVSELDGLLNNIARAEAFAQKALAAPEEEKQASVPNISYRHQLVPYGLVGVISPWNFPLTLSLIDAIPALMAGCAVILKPSEITPRFAVCLRKAIQETPELNTVFSVVDGDGKTGAALIDQVDAICFTGSVATGRLVAAQAARNFIPAFLELGGNDPALVLADADIDQAVTSLLRASILNTGQACQSIERIYVARPLFDDFVAKLVEAAERVELNKLDIHSGHIGPLIYGRQGDIIEAQLADARARGARILCGGSIERDGGVWCRPTVIVDVTPDMKLMQDETFGPVLPIVPFDNDAEAIGLANDTSFGLSAAVFSSDEGHARSVASQIDAGGISINEASLTGFVHEAEKNSFKLSGMGGSRMGPAGLTRFFRKKALIQNHGPAMSIDMFNEEAARPNDG